jgi:N-succinyldiaminopimelate aminotransferase
VSPSGRTPRLVSRLQGFGTTIFAEMTELALTHDAVNLGQGFPDADGPREMKEEATAAIHDGRNQYAPGRGVMTLRRSIADHQSRRYGLDYDPETEIVVTAGATEAVFCTVQALCEVGDEVVVFEPFYDSYEASIAMAGAVARPVRLADPDLTYDPAALEQAVGARTRLIILNSPHNPTGKVWSRDELGHLADLCVERDVVAVTDEVYEHLVYDGEHIPLASLPGMRDRTVTISSAAKTFSFTGWKIGWICAAPDLARAVLTAKQFVTFSNGTPLQHGVAVGLGLDDSYFDELRASYRSRRDRLVSGLEEVGLAPITPAGTYFVVADIRPLGMHDDIALCRQLPTSVGVAAVPVSVFHIDKTARTHLVRFAFCKAGEVIDEGISRLQRLRERDAGV